MNVLLSKTFRIDMNYIHWLTFFSFMIASKYFIRLSRFTGIAPLSFHIIACNSLWMEWYIALGKNQYYHMAWQIEIVCDNLSKVRGCAWATCTFSGKPIYNVERRYMECQNARMPDCRNHRNRATEWRKQTLIWQNRATKSHFHLGKHEMRKLAGSSRDRSFIIFHRHMQYILCN